MWNPAPCPLVWAHLLGDYRPERNPILAALSDLTRDERMVLSMLAEPNDPVTRRILARVSAAETLRLAEADGAVPGLDRVDAQVARPPDDVAASRRARRTRARSRDADLLALRFMMWPSSRCRGAGV